MKATTLVLSPTFTDLSTGHMSCLYCVSVANLLYHVLQIIVNVHNLLTRVLPIIMNVHNLSCFLPIIMIVHNLPTHMLLIIIYVHTFYVMCCQSSFIFTGFSLVCCQSSFMFTSFCLSCWQSSFIFITLYLTYKQHSYVNMSIIFPLFSLLSHHIQHTCCLSYYLCFPLHLTASNILVITVMLWWLLPHSFYVWVNT